MDRCFGHKSATLNDALRSRRGDANAHPPNPAGWNGGGGMLPDELGYDPSCAIL